MANIIKKLTQLSFFAVMVLVVFSSDANCKSLYLKYIDPPTSVYTQQRFTLRMEARILIDGDYNIVTTFQGEKNIQILNKNISWTPDENNSKYTSYITYKIKNSDFTLPTIKLAVFKNEQEIQSVEILPPQISYNQIAINDEKFSNIIADDLIVKDIKIKQYDNKRLILVANIQTKNGNLEELKIGKFKEQNIVSFKDNYPTQEIYYSIVIPKYMQTVDFQYYNLQTSSFVTVRLPVILEDDLVSTQTDLNPQDNNMLFYKQTGSLILILILILLYVQTRYKVFLAIGLFFVIIFITLILPNKKINLKSNTKVYLLPTKLSTVYKITNENLAVEIMMKKGNFVKVLFKNKHIGWVKKSDI
jgi:hypothetical protein